jgi:hypothetical protein
MQNHPVRRDDLRLKPVVSSRLQTRSSFWRIVKAN